MIDVTSFNSGHKWMNISKAGKDVLGYNSWLDGTFLCGFHALLVLVQNFSRYSSFPHSAQICMLS